MSTVRTILQQKRLPLLNQFTRSALINYRPDRRYGLELINLDVQSFYDGLVKTNKIFQFRPLATQTDVGERAAAHSTNKSHELETPYVGTELLNRLFYTHKRSSISINDFGEQVLYLGLGVLESTNAGKGKGSITAPLFLAPVRLTRKDIRSPFVLKSAGGDPVLNPALRLHLAKDHGIELPGWDVFGVEGIQTCLARIEQTIQAKAGWQVDAARGYIDFFDLAPVLHYLDLDPQNREGTDFENHPTLSALLHQGFSHTDGLNDEGLSTDMLVEPGEIAQVLDVNNEQLMVLFHAMNGANLRVEGAAGTGKTQTVVNLVADALAKKKRVLVVSNKGAALEDAFHRIGEAGLSQYVLPLFGANLERHVLAEHLKQMQLQKDSSSQREAVQLETLVRTRNKLNVYYNSIHTPIRDSGVTPYEAYTQLAELSAQAAGANMPAYDGSKFVLWTKVEFEAFLDEVKTLQMQFDRIGVAQRHPFWGSTKTVYNAALKSEIQQICRAAGMALQAVRASSGEMAHQIGARAPANSDDIIRLIRSASRALEAPDLHGVVVYNEKWESSMVDLAAILEAGAKLSSIRGRYDATLIPEAWTQDVLFVRQSLVAHGSKKTRMLIGDYRRAKDILAGLCRESVPKDTASQLKLVNGILDVQRLQQKLDQYEELAQSLFGRQWQGIHSNWEHLDNVSSWLIKLHHEIGDRQVIPELLDYLVQFPNLDRLRQLAERVAKDFNIFLETSRHAANEVGMHDALGMSKPAFGRVPFGSLLSLFAHWEKHIDSLQDVVAFNHVAVRLTEKGMEDVVKIAVSWSESSKLLASCIHAARYKALLTDVLKTRSTLSSFDEHGHAQTIQQFSELDEAHMAQMAKEIIDTQAERYLQNRLPSKVYRALIFELEEPPKRTLRELMTDAGKAVQDIKPVFLMTPSSVSNLLTETNIRFDLVIFEEAGRLSVTDTLSSLLRSSQLIALGDSRQAGARRFFDHVSIQNTEESTVTLDTEGLMRVLRQRGATELQLSWVCHTTPFPIIEYVNQNVYEGRLVTFPGTVAEKIQRSIHVHDLSGRAHVQNGQAIRSLMSELVDQVIKHKLQNPNQSAGLVVRTVGELEAIEWELERRIRKDPKIDSLLNGSSSESFMLKTIEQAQGEQRDIVFVGLLFKNTMRIQENNMLGSPHVAEELQKLQTTLASLSRRQLHFYVDANTNALRELAVNHPSLTEWVNLLEWAQRGATKAGMRNAPLAYQLALAGALKEKGYRCIVQYGSGKMYLDLAIEHPQYAGRFILGIFGDGFPYKNAAIVRDRDRLHPDILERKGWKLYRLWSVEWFRNPHREIEKICARIESILEENKEEDQFVPATVYTKTTSNGSHPSIHNDYSNS